MIGDRKMRTAREFIAPFLLFIIIFSLSGCLRDTDADNDALPDNIEREGWEVRVTYPGEEQSTTINVTSSTHKKDTDGDGLTDYEEWSTSNGYITNPREKDTDGDGLTDYEEIINFSSDPLHWADDIDKDNGWWKGDYQEILYYQSRGIDNGTIRQFLRKSDVDGDGIKDGSDIDPLSNLTIKIWIKSIKITSDMDDNDNGEIKIETVFNMTTDRDYASSNEILIPIDYNYPVNLNWTLDLNDKGIPGGNNSVSLAVLDQDTKLAERKPFDEIPGQGDGFAEMDIVRIDGNGSYVNNTFNMLWVFGDYISVDNASNITSDSKKYPLHLTGDDAEIWFEIEDKRIRWTLTN